jgi:hypothetical protein
VNLEATVLAKQACGYCPTSIASQQIVSNEISSSLSAGIHACGHGIYIHRVQQNKEGKLTHPCWFPGCDCKDYRPEKQK